ncbi:UBN2_3 domain-containing protein, partial [Cephalotus follicularis]
ISNISNLIPIKLNHTNYLLWKSLFEPILRGHKLMHYIDGSLPPPAPTDSTFAAWYEKDQMLVSWINATLSETALPYIMGVNSSKQAWDILNRRYASTTPSHVLSLRRKLSRVKKGSQSMHEYLQQFKELAD